MASLFGTSPGKLFNRKKKGSDAEAESKMTEEKVATPSGAKGVPPYPAPPVPVSPAGDLAFRKEAHHIERMIAKLAEDHVDKAPPFLVPVLKNIGPIVGKIIVAGEAAAPFVVKGYETCVYLNETLPMDLISALWGLILCFFGGTFGLTLAAYEAFKISGKFVSCVGSPDDVFLITHFSPTCLFYLFLALFS